MPDFVLNRTHNLVGKGHNVRFTKGVPVWVPPELLREALSIGAEPIGEKVDPLGPEEVPEVQLTTADKEALFFAAFETLTARNEREDFGGDGRPSMPALKKLIDFSFDKKERDVNYQKFRELKAATLESE
jgi:hypothetical protein